MDNPTIIVIGSLYPLMSRTMTPPNLFKLVNRPAKHDMMGPCKCGRRTRHEMCLQCQQKETHEK